MKCTKKTLRPAEIRTQNLPFARRFSTCLINFLHKKNSLYIFWFWFENCYVIKYFKTKFLDIILLVYNSQNTTRQTARVYRKYFQWISFAKCRTKIRFLHQHPTDFPVVVVPFCEKVVFQIGHRFHALAVIFFFHFFRKINCAYTEVGD